MESTKKKVGLFLPIALADALDHVASRVGKKQKWLVVGAALIRLLESREEEQNELIRRVKIADLPGGSFTSLIAQAKSKARGGAEFESLVGFEDAGGTGAGRGGKRSAQKPRRAGVSRRA